MSKRKPAPNYLPPQKQVQPEFCNARIGVPSITHTKDYYKKDPWYVSLFKGIGLFILGCLVAAALVIFYLLSVLGFFVGLVWGIYVFPFALIAFLFYKEYPYPDWGRFNFCRECWKIISDPFDLFNF